jgi:hypothetical protein
LYSPVADRRCTVRYRHYQHHPSEESFRGIQSLANIIASFFCAVSSVVGRYLFVLTKLSQNRCALLMLSILVEVMSSQRITDQKMRCLRWKKYLGIDMYCNRSCNKNQGQLIPVPDNGFLVSNSTICTTKALVTKNVPRHQISRSSRLQSLVGSLRARVKGR